MNQRDQEIRSLKEEIHSLKERIAELEAALEPMARLIKYVHPHDQSEWVHEAGRLFAGDIQRAAAVLRERAMWRRAR